MRPAERPKTLLRAMHDTAQNYAVAAIIAFIVALFLPWWLRWILVHLCGLAFLATVIAPFVDDYRPRSRVQPNEKAVFITGCDSGFGHQLAQRLDDLHLQVFAGCLFPEGEGAESLKRTASDRLHIVQVDVTSDESVQKAFQYVSDNLQQNKLWAVVNNAGLNDGAELFWTNTDIIRKIIDVNTFGVVRVTKAFLPLLRKFKGRVVNVASAAGRYTYPGMVPYCISKHAVVSFSDGLRLEMYRFGIKVITVEPWMYKTPITNDSTILEYIQKTWDTSPPETRENLPDDYLLRYKKSTLKFITFSISDKPQQVVDCLEEAVMAMNPKYSYSPGTLYSRTMFWVLSRLPKPIADVAIHDECAVGLD